MRVGNLVKYKDDIKELTGIVKTKEGKNWFKVVWADNVILSEHVDDLQVLSGETQNKKKRESK